VVADTDKQLSRRNMLINFIFNSIFTVRCIGTVFRFFSIFTYGFNC